MLLVSRLIIIISKNQQQRYNKTFFTNKRILLKTAHQGNKSSVRVKTIPWTAVGAFSVQTPSGTNNGKLKSNADSITVELYTKLPHKKCAKVTIELAKDSNTNANEVVDYLNKKLLAEKGINVNKAEKASACVFINMWKGSSNCQIHVIYTLNLLQKNKHSHLKKQNKTRKIQFNRMILRRKLKTSFPTVWSIG